jgi:hypothetical protein
VKTDQAATTSAVAARKAAAAAPSYCGASHEPVYRTMDEATASGLELCDSCVLLFRRRNKAG